jgi:tRNA pseudouridine65 synthase
VLEIVYQDEYLIAINKPHGLLVHRSKIADDATEFALQMLRDQIGRHVNPAHRLDRKTGGVLLFAFDKETEIAMQKQFQESLVDKNYLAIVRGYAPAEMEIDYPLAKENGTLQEAQTSFITLQQSEIPLEIGKHPTSRYSLVKANPKTGRMHQLRKHFAHIFHPIIGDRPHGCNKQNRYFKEHLQMNTMMLHALDLSFNHPVTEEKITIKAEVQDEFKRMMALMNFTL